MKSYIRSLNRDADYLALTRTENGALAYASTGSKVLDLFVALNRNMSKTYLRKLTAAAWNESPYNVIRVIFHARDCRNGKGERALSRELMLWLSENHPSLYIKYMVPFVSLGYFMDLVHLYKDRGEARPENPPQLLHNIINGVQAAGHCSSLPKDFELRLLCEQLKEDYEQLIKNKSISLAAKWAPSECSKYKDIARQLARLMYPKDPQAYRNYRRILTKLRYKIQTIEYLMSHDKWDNIKFDCIPALAHQRYKKAIIKRQNERYMEYLEQLKNGCAKIKTSGLQPYQIVQNMKDEDMDNARETMLEETWKQMISNMRKTISDNMNTVCVVDVSGSMHTGLKPPAIDVAVSLGLFAAELCKGPFNNKIITFSEDPQIIDISGNRGLREKIQQIEHMIWSMNTNIEKVYDLILNLCQYEAPQNRINRVIICTDMQFDVATREKDDELLFMRVSNKFARANLKLPQLIYWNLSSSHNNAFPVNMSQTGVCYLSGYSAEIMRAIMNCDIITPYQIMEYILEPYTKYLGETCDGAPSSQ